MANSIATPFRTCLAVMLVIVSCSGQTCPPLCHSEATCNDGSTCVCNAGYIGDGTTTCTDINECTDAGSNQHQCMNAQCMNNEGSYTCTCNTGFSDSGDGRTCTDINECTASGSYQHQCVNAQCMNTIGSYTCTCNTGFSDSGDGRMCTDDPPVIGTCPSSLNGVADPGSTTTTSVTWTNPTATDTIDTSPTVTCSPASGSSLTIGNHDGTCTATDNAGNTDTCTFTVFVTDFNECTAAPGDGGHVCINADCVNTDGGYSCTCQPGYSKPNNVDDTECTDTEPPVFNAGTCPPSMTHVADPRSMTTSVTWTDPTATDTSGDTPTVTCTPSSGYALTIGSETVTCTARDTAGNSAVSDCTFTVIVTDFDECTAVGVGRHVCVNADCVNTDGGYTCTCLPGYSKPNMDDTTCTDFDECNVAPDDAARHDCINADCVNTDGGYTCTCLPGYSKPNMDDTECTDTEPPVFDAGTCPSSMTHVADPRSMTTSVIWTDPTATDTTGDIPTVTCSPSSEYDFTIGSETVTCSARDAAGNKAVSDCTFTVTVTAADATPPVFTNCPTAGFTETIPVGSNTVLVQWPTLMATDNSGNAPAIVLVTGSGPGSYVAGTYQVTYRATDSAGLTADCTFAIQVTPVVDIVCPANITASASPGSTATRVNWLEPVLTGWDGPTNFTASTDPGAMLLIGTHRVIYQQWFSVNSPVLSCSFYVTVEGFCPIDTSIEGLTWPETAAGSTAKSVERCSLMTQNAGQPLAVRNCSIVEAPAYFQWEDQYESQSCGTTKNEVTLEEVQEVEVTQGNVVEVAEFLANQTSDLPDAEDVEVISDVLMNIVNTGTGDIEVTELVIETVNNVITSTDADPDTSDINSASSAAIVQSVETQVALSLRQGGQVSIRQDTIHVEAVSLDPMQAKNGLSFVSVQQPSSPNQQPAEGSLSGTDVKTYVNTSEIPKDVVASIRLPANTVDLLQSTNGNQSAPLRASFIVYADDTLFQSEMIRKSPGENGSSLRIAGSVVSLTVEGVELVNLTEPVVIQFMAPEINKTEANRTSIQCVFWDFDLNDQGGDWSMMGCMLADQTDASVSCHCNHATNFAILVDVEGQAPDSDVPPHIRKALDIISQVGCVLSIISLAILLIVYLAFRTLRVGRSRQIFISFCISLLMLYIVFLAGVDNARGSGGGCVFVAALLHYLTLTTMMWMGVEARNMYVSTVKVFPDDSSRYMLKASLIAWGSPVLVLTITLAAASNHYNNEHYCFLQPDLVLYIGLLVPIGAILIHNIITFVLVMRSLLKVQEVSRSQQISKRLQNAIGISALLGLTWVFGFLAISDATFVFQLIFCLANSLQGVVVFVLFGVRRDEVRSAVAPYLRRICCIRTCRVSRPNEKESYNVATVSTSVASSPSNAQTSTFDMSAIDISANQ